MHAYILFFKFEFLYFLLPTFVLFWLVPIKFRSTVLCLASYTFYALWDYRFIIFLIFSTIIDYACALKITRINKQKDKVFLYISIFSNLAMLSIFKYYNFFVPKIIEATSLNIPLNIILPLGISFYTFQSISYTVDVYRGYLKAETSFIKFSLFVSYFPQLIAGPIERAQNLLGQIQNLKSKFQEIQFAKAFHLFFIGFMKKSLIGDNIGLIVDSAFDVTQNNTSLYTLIGMIAFSIQVYADMSGYCDMARGISLLFGIKLTNNFNFPFFSKSPSEFWNNWHITLSHWFRDYVYIPILVNYKKPSLAALVTFSLVGVWHGTNLIFLLWGILWAMIIISYNQIPALKKNKGVASSIIMFLIILITQAFYRSVDLATFSNLFSKLVTETFWNIEQLPELYTLFGCSLIFILYEFFCYYTKDKDLDKVLAYNFYAKCFFYLFLLLTYRLVGTMSSKKFIYFDF